MPRRQIILLICTAALALLPLSPVAAFEDQTQASRALAEIRKTFGPRWGGGWHVPDGIGVRVVGLTHEDEAVIRAISGPDLEADILPATYSRKEIIEFMDVVDRNMDNPNLDPIVGYGPDDTLGKLGILIETPGVTTVRKLYSLFPPNAVHVECCARMGAFWTPTFVEQLRDAAIVVVALVVIFLFAARVGRVRPATR